MGPSPPQSRVESPTRLHAPLRLPPHPSSSAPRSPRTSLGRTFLAPLVHPFTSPSDRCPPGSCAQPAELHPDVNVTTLSPKVYSPSWLPGVLEPDSSPDLTPELQTCPPGSRLASRPPSPRQVPQSLLTWACPNLNSSLMGVYVLYLNWWYHRPPSYSTRNLEGLPLSAVPTSTHEVPPALPPEDSVPCPLCPYQHQPHPRLCHPHGATAVLTRATRDRVTSSFRTVQGSPFLEPELY